MKTRNILLSLLLCLNLSAAMVSGLPETNTVPSGGWLLIDVPDGEGGFRARKIPVTFFTNPEQLMISREITNHNAIRTGALSIILTNLQGDGFLDDLEYPITVQAGDAVIDLKSDGEGQHSSGVTLRTMSSPGVQKNGFHLGLLNDGRIKLVSMNTNRSYVQAEVDGRFFEFGTNGGMKIQGDDARLVFLNLTNTTDQKRWMLDTQPNSVRLTFDTDAGTPNSVVQWLREGNNLTGMSVSAPVTATSFAVATGQSITSGIGTPEGAVTAPVGSLFLRTDGDAATTLYVKTSGTGNTGWTAK